MRAIHDTDRAEKEMVIGIAPKKLFFRRCRPDTLLRVRATQSELNKAPDLLAVGLHKV